MKHTVAPVRGVESTLCRADILAAKLYLSILDGHSLALRRSPHVCTSAAAEAFDQAQAFMAEAARRNCYTGEIQAQHVGLPVDEMVTVVDGAEVVTT